MTELQQAEFEILKQAVSVCEALGLRYFLVCGSALGAVKYGGFIPWDDDVDLALPREDYERFLEAAPGLLPPELVVQNYRTERYCPNLFTKLRNRNTTFVEASAAELPICHGVFIDLFPLDRYPASGLRARRVELRKRVLLGLASSVYCSPKRGRALLYDRLGRLLGVRERLPKLMNRLEKTLIQPENRAGPILCNHGNWQGKKDYFPQTVFAEGVPASFEGLAVVVPKEYDVYLTQKYGDWRADLPEEQKVGHHAASRCDLKTPYTESLQNRI